MKILVTGGGGFLGQALCRGLVARGHQVVSFNRGHYPVLAELGVGTWIAGLRRSQSRSRAAIEPLARQDGRFKLSPIHDWSDRDV